ncbi:hypothetical protein IFM89_017075 [Coptis chinensis]|uniref:Uncharacterized protein n=1 Tax=Coptis chinensis TaxID=261450 RepID=A0A835M548_9MAGN|nr:hypothetical protein IFM89_017075 [Coptis chinensis]
MKFPIGDEIQTRLSSIDDLGYCSVSVSVPTIGVLMKLAWALLNEDSDWANCMKAKYTNRVGGVKKAFAGLEQAITRTN